MHKKSCNDKIKLIILLNGKVYVGQTCFDIKKRFYELSQSGTVIGRAIRDYGKNFFKITLIEECETEEELNEREKFWIEKLNSKVPNGYNGMNGGGKNRKISSPSSPPYTIQQVSAMTKIPASAIRFYDKKGLLPFLKRTESGYRIFSKLDLSSLQLIECLKMTGLSIDDIKKFADWVRQGDVTLPQRYEMLVEQKAAVEKQIENIKKLWKSLTIR